MQDSDWHSPSAHIFGVRLNGTMLNEFDMRGRAIIGRTLTIIFNSSATDARFVLFWIEKAQYWWPILNASTWVPLQKRIRGGDEIDVIARSIQVLELRRIWPAFLAEFLFPRR